MSEKLPHQPGFVIYTFNLQQLMQQIPIKSYRQYFTAYVTQMSPCHNTAWALSIIRCMILSVTKITTSKSRSQNCYKLRYVSYKQLN
jgi:hypothetical protein